jgi:hypothetical protein
MPVGWGANPAGDSTPIELRPESNSTASKCS